MSYEQDHAETFTLNGEEFKYWAESDECMSIMDEQGEGVWCGQLEWVRPNDRYYGNEHAIRPSNFTGNAEVLDRDGRSCLWWEPAGDVKRSDPNFAAMRRSVLEAYNEGYYILSVEHVATGDTEYLGGMCGYDYVGMLAEAKSLAGGILARLASESRAAQWATDHDCVYA